MSDYPNSFSDMVKPEIRDGLKGKGIRPRWQREPGLLGRLVASVLELGRIDLACANNMVSKHSMDHWLDQGHKEADIAEKEGVDWYTPLAQFYWEIKQAQSLYVSSRIRSIQQMADSGDPEYKNFLLWLAENVDEEKRFSRFVRTESTEKKDVTITVRYANGSEWVNGTPAQEAVEGEFVDTTMRAIEAGPPVEDF